jgi:predicted permease
MRLLTRRRSFTALAVVTFAIGLAAATSIYSVVDALLVRPLPYRNPDRIVQIVSHRMDGKTPVRSASMARPYLLALRDRTRTLSSVGAYDSFSNLTRRRLALTLEGADGVAELLGTRISPALLTMLGVAPALGRPFESAHEQPGHNGVILLSHRTWRTHFGSDAAILGRPLRLDKRLYLIIGVMPEGFEFPDRHTDFWIPLTPATIPPPSAPREDSPDSGYADGVFARLRDATPIQTAAAEVESILRETDRELAAERYRSVDRTGFPSWLPRRAEVVSMKDEVIAPARPLLRVLSFAVLCVLLISCANAVNLLLAGAASRQREIATQMALGAGRLRLIRQALIESVVLSLGGGLLAIPLAYCALRVVTHLAPADLPRVQEVGLNMPLLASALGLSSVVGVVAGLFPAWHMATDRAQRETLLRQAASSTVSAGGFVGWGLRRLLVIAEIALAVVLLAGAGLLIRSFASLTRVDLGYDARDVMAFQVIVPPTRSAAEGFYSEVLARLESIPGVEAVGATDVLPLAGSSAYRFVLGGLPTPSGPGDAMVMRLISPDYFRALGIRLLSGRTLSDNPRRAEIVLNEEFVRRYFGHENPLGRIVGRGFDAYEVVGVVADVRHEGFGGGVQPEYFVDLRLSGLVASIRPFFVVRTPRAPSELLPVIRSVLRQLDPQTGIAANVAAMADIVSESVSRPGFNTTMVTAFAVLASLLAAIAVYGVMAYAVTQRWREIGVRVTLGARRVDVVALVLRQSAIMTGLGTLVGLAGALAITRSMQTMLFGVTPLDPVTFVAAPVVFSVVAALASYVPIYRATRVDPAVALRAE